MEIEELKASWSEINQRLEKQEGVTQELIVQMTQQKSSLILKPIIDIEKLGIALSLGMLLFLFLNVGKLTDWLSIASAICVGGILITGIVLSIILMAKARNVNVVEKDYHQTLIDVSRLKKFQYTSKWISTCLGLVLVVAILPTLAATWFDKILLHDLEEYVESLVPILLVVPIVWYFIGRFYAKKMDQINKLMEDISE